MAIGSTKSRLAHRIEDVAQERRRRRTAPPRAPERHERSSVPNLQAADDGEETQIRRRGRHDDTEGSERMRSEVVEAPKDDERLARISHELRNPIHAVLGWTTLLLDRLEQVDREELRTALRVIARQSRRQLRLVDDILDYERISTGKLSVHPGTVDVGAVVEGVVKGAEIEATAKDIVIRTSIDPTIESTVGDEDRLGQIVSNLVTNAIKFTPAHGRIQVDVTRRGESVLVRVCDSGVGIPSTQLPFVFDEYWQAPGTTSNGLGLGLAIVRELASLLGATIHVESDGVNRGTTFEVSLPVHHALPPPPLSPIAADDPNEDPNTRTTVRPRRRKGR